MPKGGKKGNKKSSTSFTTDVTLEDYANSSVSVARLRKPATNCLAREVKSLCSTEKSWFERDIEEFEFFGTEADDNVTTSAIEKKKSFGTKSHRSKPGSSCLNSSVGLHYPIDLWYLIGEYIKPEDVSTFAVLCKASHHVTQTYKFWMDMYKRFYRSGIQLPVRLQPECIERPYCLKPCVIRALFYLYPHFIECMSSHPTRTSCDIQKLVNSVCVSMWRSQNDGKWLFYFKFSSKPFNTSCLVKKREDVNWWASIDGVNHDPQALLNDVNLNPDDGCKILHVKSSYFIAVSPVVMGSRLADVRISLARDMIHHKLQLTFSFSNYVLRSNGRSSVAPKDIGSNGEIVEFDPVDSMAIWNWWHPQYPTGTKFEVW